MPASDELKHTPGPWTFEPHGNTVALYSGRSRDRHGLRLMNLDDGDANFEANARLIARAPDLLTENTALKATIQILERRIAGAQVCPRCGGSTNIPIDNNDCVECPACINVVTSRRGELDG